MSSDGASPSDPDAAPSRTGNCGETSTRCDFASAQCCVTLYGTESAAARIFGGTSAACMEIGGPNCGGYVSVAGDFTMKFPQRCASDADCGAGELCCVMPFDRDRFSKKIGSIHCVAADECNANGRHLCSSQTDCGPTENCIPETDPILSHVYERFCF